MSLYLDRTMHGYVTPPLRLSHLHVACFPACLTDDSAEEARQ
jgi:hypothetical protein